MASIRRIPDRLTGKWAVVSSQIRGQEKMGGEILEEWVISPDSLQCEAGLLVVKKVEESNEPHQAMVLVSFSNNNLQYAFLSSKNRADVILVVMYLDGDEQMRCAITQAVYRD